MFELWEGLAVLIGLWKSKSWNCKRWKFEEKGNGTQSIVYTSIHPTRQCIYGEKESDGFLLLNCIFYKYVLF
jgi:hypothetical protein